MMASLSGKQRIAVDIVSDVMCPWCWVGKRKLESAMKLAADKYEFIVRWHPYFLRPDMPKDGAPKPPSTLGNPRVGERLREEGEKVGIHFTGKADRYPNTQQAHVLLEYALERLGSRGQNDIAEDIFQAYFTDGLQPNETTLVTIAKKHGLNDEEAKQVLKDDERLKSVKSAALEWSNKGVTGVPAFFMNGGPTFSGAQDVSVFTKIFDVVAQKRPLSEDMSMTSASL